MFKLWFFIGVLVLLFCCPLFASALDIPLAVSSIYLNCFAGGPSEFSATGNVGLTGACDNSISWPYTSVTDQIVGEANTGLDLEPLPLAAVQGSAAAFGGPSPGSAFWGSAWAEYYVVIESTATPPTGISSIPVIVTVLGETRVSGCCAQDTYSLTTLDGTQYFPGTGYLTLALDVVHQVAVEAGCMAWVGGAVTQSECQAVADPAFMFDQAAFDAMMGPDTFPLSDYFGFAYSPNMSAVPEPCSLLLMGLGVLGMVSVLRRKLAH
jgi:PEP-CTERM motif